MSTVDASEEKRFENIMVKGENAGKKHFSFLHNVYYPIKDEFNPFPNKPCFMCLHVKSIKNNVGKGEISHNQQFILFPQCFLPIWRTFYHLYYI